MDENWYVDCSDDELKSVQDSWEPSAEEITRLYDMLDQGEIPPLKWKCPGYRSPSPEFVEQSQEEDTNKQTEHKSDFDFMDEMSSPKLKIRNKNDDTLKGSAKKKTTSLDGVLNNMRRHNLLPHSNNSKS